MLPLPHDPLVSDYADREVELVDGVLEADYKFWRFPWTIIQAER